MELQNKVCWITGASSGIGEGLAKELAKNGCRLVLSARNLIELNRVKTETGLADKDCICLPMDMQDIASFDSKVKQVIDQMGRIDLVFHNAGISQRGMMKDTPFEVDRQVMEINFMSVVALTKLVLPQMFVQNFGHFVITSSVAGKLGTPMRSAYCASKHALNGYFDSLRAELWPQNIGATICCPGYIKTNISINAVGANGQKFGQMDKNQAHGMSVETCVKKMVEAVKAEKREVLIGGKETLGVYIKRFFPGILAKMVKKYNIETV